MEKIKHFYESEKGKDLMIIIIVVLVGISSFFLGRLSSNSSNNGLKIEYTGQGATNTGINGSNMPKIELNQGITERVQKNTSGKYFASKNGHKYYSAGCSAGKSIKQENRIYFSSSTEAEKAGFVMSSSCQ